MKTLKKTLCLVLAVVMVVGVLILPASAAGFVDDDKIVHEEAVTVLTALNVLTGDENGFRPGDTLSRAEAATVISKLVQTPAIANRYPSGRTGFADVDQSKDFDWASGYIAYTATKGIISGTEKGFEPERNVTGTEFAKMLLCALGYDQVVEGFMGDLWDINVISVALSVELDAGIDNFDYDADLTRDNMAQLCYNALLNVNRVVYVDGLLRYLTNADGSANTLNDYKNYKVDATDNVGEDDFKRPVSHNVAIDGKDVYTTYNGGVASTYNTAKSLKDIFTELKLKDNVKVRYYVDGAQKKVTDPANTETNVETVAADTANTVGGQGWTTNVYKTTETIEGKEEVVYRICTVKPHVITVTDKNYKDGVLTVAKDVTVKIEAAKDDIVVWHGTADKVVEAYKATVINGAVTAKSTSTDKYIRIDSSSKVYRASGIDEPANIDLAVSADAKYFFYLDKYENIVAVKNDEGTAVTPDDKYTYVLGYYEQAFVAGTDETVDIFGNVKPGTPEVPAAAAVVVMDLETGLVSTKNLQIAKKDNKYYFVNANGAADTTKEVDGKLSTEVTTGFNKYIENEAGQYILTEAVTGSTIGYDTAKKNTITVDGGTKYLSGTSKLTIFTHDNKDTAEQPLDDVFTPANYTGYANFPAVTNVAGTTLENNQKALVLTSGDMVTAVYVIVTGKPTSDVVPPDADTTRAIFLEKGEQTTTGTSYTFLVGKEVKTYVADNSTVLTLEAKGIYSLTFDEKTGKLTAATAATGTSATIKLGTAEYLVFTGSEATVSVDPNCVVVDATEDVPVVGVLPDLSKNTVVVTYFKVGGNGDNKDAIALIVITSITEITD